MDTGPVIPAVFVGLFGAGMVFFNQYTEQSLMGKYAENRETYVKLARDKARVDVMQRVADASCEIAKPASVAMRGLATHLYVEIDQLAMFYELERPWKTMMPSDLQQDYDATRNQMLTKYHNDIYSDCNAANLVDDFHTLLGEYPQFAQK